MGWRVHMDTIIMVQTTECMISTIYIVVNINKTKIKLSLTNDEVAIAVGISVGGVVLSGVIVGGSGGALATAVDVSTGAAVAADNDNAIGAVIPLSLTNDKDAYVSA